MKEGKMPRAKTASDELYNARRRAKRQVARLEKQLSSMKGTDRRGTEALISALKSNIEKTYTNKGFSKETIQKAAETLNASTQAKRNTAQARKNKAFQKALNTASDEDEGASINSGVSGKSTHIFYAATRNLWEGASLKDRNQLIMQRLGVGSLEEAYNMVMAANKEALKRAKTLGKGGGYTDENEAFYKGEDEQDQQGSPNYLDFVNMF